jgi:HSP20 family molecular chaperone IbpA
MRRKALEREASILENRNLPALLNKHHHSNPILSFIQMLEDLLGASCRNSTAALREDGDELILSIDIPGFDPQDLDVTVKNNMVILKGHRQQEELRDQPGYYFAARSRHSFYQTVPLPAGVKPENTVIQCNNGVLELKMCKGRSYVQSFQPLAGPGRRSLLE